MSNDQVIQKQTDNLVKSNQLFTSLDVSNSIKRSGTWIKHTEVAEWLRNNFNAPDYNKDIISVANGEQAFLYYPELSDPSSYVKTNQSAITPQEFDALLKQKTKKKIASSLIDILDTENMQIILDRTQPIQPVIDDMLSHWNYDLFTRKPGKAYTDDNVFVGTDLDMACFLFALADRGAVINIPKYEGRRPTQKTAGEIITSKDNRHGKLLGISANKENFSFSVRINDMNVMTTDTVGNFRNFMLVDMDGKWYDGWKCLEFIPDAKENDFILKNDLLTDNSIIFKNFVHPNRWTSFYGQYYFVTKALVDRLTEEAKYLKDAAAEMRKRGIKIMGSGQGGEKKEWPKKTVVGDQKSIKITAFESELDYPAIEGQYNPACISMLPDYQGSNDSDLLKAVEDRARQLTYNLIPKLRFATRATEYAFHFNSDNGLKMPSWIQNARWDRNYVLSGKKKVWNRLVFSRGIAIRYRAYDKSEIVASEE